VRQAREILLSELNVNTLKTNKQNIRSFKGQDQFKEVWKTLKGHLTLIS